jgi:glycosyltransferase involved in cell wall biosynthesis
MERKILILTYDFPPYISVGGLRPNAWFKYFNEFGFHPIVVTRQWDNKYGDFRDYISSSESQETLKEEFQIGTILRAPYFPNFSNKLLLRYGKEKYALMRKIYSGLTEFIQFPLPIGPKRTLYLTAREYLLKNKVDYIVVTGDPFILFKYASSLSKQFNIPWIADYRDPWTLNGEQNKSWLVKRYFGFFENKYVKTASFITTVSKFVEFKIRKTNNTNVPPVHIISNGFDDEAIDDIKNINQNRKMLTISFVGTLYDWHPYVQFLKVCNDFFDETNERFSIKFYGTNRNNEIINLVERDYKNLDGYIEVISKIPNKTLLTELAQDNVMLLFNYYSYMGTKIFDYIAIKRKIILCFTEDSDALKLKEQFYNIDENSVFSGQLQADLIKETNSGIIVKDQIELKQILLDLIQEFKEQSYISCETKNIDNYSRKFNVKRLADIIRRNDF